MYRQPLFFCNVPFFIIVANSGNLLPFTALQKAQFCEQQHASRCTDTEHSAPYRAGCLGIFMRRRIKTPRGTVAVNSN